MSHVIGLLLAFYASISKSNVFSFAHFAMTILILIAFFFLFRVNGALDDVEILVAG